MDIEGVCYDTGRVYPRALPDPAATRRELRIIRDDLQCNAVRFHGTDITGRPTAATKALAPELADRRAWPLPIFGERPGTLGEVSDPTYPEPIVRAWNKKVKRADAFIVVTPEYNHSIPGGLKNAIDSVWLSFGFRNQPVAAVSYSGSIGGGIIA